MTHTILHGDCIEQMRTLPDNSVDAVVTDPPAGIAFMGKAWDSDKGGRAQWVAWLTEVMIEAQRVLKPGGHALVWALPRTSHWTALALEDAGFEIRDAIYHLQGAGFPKSLSVNKQAVAKGLSCQCQTDAVYYPYGTQDASRNEDLRDLRAGMDSADTVSGSPQQDVLAGMQRQTDIAIEDGETSRPDTNGHMPLLREAVRHPESSRQSTSKVLLSELSSEGSCRTEGYGSDRGARSRGVDGTEQHHLSPEDERRKQSGMAGRRDVLAETWELSADQVHSLSGRSAINGSQGQLRDGASRHRGANGSASVDANGSCPPSRPQSSEQHAAEPRTVAEQSDTQAGGAWPTCERCSLPIIPDGLGTALKPAAEVWWLCRKPLSEPTVAANVLRWGTGALNIDGCRISVPEHDPNKRQNAEAHHYTADSGYSGGWGMARASTTHHIGRWPANVLLSHHPDCVPCGVKRVKGGTAVRHNGVGNPGYGGNAGLLPEGTPDLGYTDADGYETVEAWNCVEECPVAMLDAQSGELAAGNHPRVRNTSGYSGGLQQGETGYDGLRMDSGGASRFFYVAKASRKERRGSTHPTVKPVALMRYLVRLITPTNGIVLDPFAGSGTTGEACVLEGFDCILIEREAEYIADIQARFSAVQPPLGMVAD